MTARVSSLYRNGHRLNSKVAETVEGDLNLMVSRNPVTGLACTEAVILNDEGGSLLNDMHDVVCVCIAAHGLRLRGTEYAKGREVAQEWWCVPVAEESVKA